VKTHFFDIRIRYLLAISVVCLGINAFLRLFLQIQFPADLPFFTSQTLSNLLAGVINDLGALVFLLAPSIFFLCFATDRFLHRKPGKFVCIFLLFCYFAQFAFGAVAEYYFWEEFQTRFNFIAVDYLIYTTEVTQNMIESYPLPLILTIVAITGIVLTFLTWRFFVSPRKKTNVNAPTRIRKRLLYLLGYVVFGALVFLFFNPLIVSDNRYWKEYSKNGTYELFSAYLHNQLDYRLFYPTMEKEKAFQVLKKDLGIKENLYPKEDNLIYDVPSKGAFKTPNVVLVILESTGIEWLDDTYMPNLRKLSGEGLSFTNMLSTGTRTVRGLEAVMLSVPPTPGSSIVRRPDNKELFSLATLFKKHNYTLTFVYGGYGYFDNMNAFYANNGYKVLDRLTYDAQNKTFANAWGQCDEDMYSQSLSEADLSYAAKKPFHQVLLSTSNHRPFTYPEGKVKLPSGSGREGAVMYSDYAIGAYIEKAKQKPWFENTIFIFIGDHPHGIAGKTDLPPDAYGIVCTMYGPKFFTPQKVETLCSQIDVAPTLLAKLGWGYRSQFFGKDILSMKPEEGRAWIATYQLLGFRDNTGLVVLAPNSKPEFFLFKTTKSNDKWRSQMLERTISSYQCAYDLFTQGHMKESYVLKNEK